MERISILSDIDFVVENITYIFVKDMFLNVGPYFLFKSRVKNKSETLIGSSTVSPMGR
jgi:hypothetical protein